MIFGWLAVGAIVAASIIAQELFRQHAELVRWQSVEDSWESS